jgi:hypothetical protein
LEIFVTFTFFNLSKKRSLKWESFPFGNSLCNDTGIAIEMFSVHSRKLPTGVSGFLDSNTGASFAESKGHGQHRSPESPWPILKNLLYFIFCVCVCHHNKQFYDTSKKGHCLGIPQACICDLEVRISIV